MNLDSVAALTGIVAALTGIVAAPRYAIDLAFCSVSLAVYPDSRFWIMLCRQRVSTVLLWLGAFIAAGSVPWLRFLEKESPRVRSVVAASSNITSYRLLQSPGPKKCWVFTHMGKAGGSTVKGLMDASIKHTHHTIGLYQNHQWMRGKDSVKKGLETTKYTMIFGPYAEALRPYGGNNCKWFTMFRQ